jgi:hypothetical protein
MNGGLKESQLLRLTENILSACIPSFKRFEYWLVLFDKTKTELIRHLVYRERAEFFVISHLSWRDREHIVYKFGGPKKLFTYSIDDLLQSRVAELPEKIHLMFK